MGCTKKCQKVKGAAGLKSVRIADTYLIYGRIFYSLTSNTLHRHSDYIYNSMVKAYICHK